jgi:hypothetical protein
MSTEITPMGFPALYYAETQTGRTVTAGTAMKLAHAADVVALCRFPKWLNIPDARPGTYQVSYSSSELASLLYLAWYYRIPDVGNPGDTLAVKLEITDGTNTVAYTDARIPRAFQSVDTLISYEQPLSNPACMTRAGSGWLDLVALRTTLTASSDWQMTFTVSRASGTVAYVDRIEGWEVPRSVMSDADTAGVLAGPFNPGNPIVSGSTTTLGWERMEQTTRAALAVQPRYLSLAWIESTTPAFNVPHTSSAAYTALTHLAESAGVPVAFVVRVRPMTVVAPSGTVAGEAARWRVLVYVTGGAAADVRLSTGATGSPYSITGLGGAAWTWSAWHSIALPTNATGQLATLTITARVTGGATVYLAGVVVEGVGP